MTNALITGVIKAPQKRATPSKGGGSDQRRLLIIGGGLAALLVVVLGGFFLLGASGSGTNADEGAGEITGVGVGAVPGWRPPLTNLDPNHHN